jgi:hypothetical protein
MTAKFATKRGRFHQFGLLTPSVGGQLIRINLDDISYTK